MPCFLLHNTLCGFGNCSLLVQLLTTGFQRNVSWQLFPTVLFIMVLVQLVLEFVNEILRQMKAPE